jgi:hypothetical protein
LSTLVYAHGADDFASAFAEIVKDGDGFSPACRAGLPRKRHLVAQAGALMAYSEDIGAVYR